MVDLLRFSDITRVFVYLTCLPQSNDIHFMSNEAVVEAIIKERKSLARFGDGELRWLMQDDTVPSFQVGSEELSTRLKQVLLSDLESLIIAVPKPLFSGRGLRYGSARFYLLFMARWHKALKEILRRDRPYADTMISRPFMDYRRVYDFKSRFDLLSSAWNDRDVLIVEGERTRFGVGNDLLDKACSVRRITCPAENAFGVFEKILRELLKNARKSDLILACLGPTATVLAFELCRKGYQVIDVGHFDIEYEWYLRGSRNKEPILGKYTNEAGYKGTDELDDGAYKASIIAKIERW